MVFTCHPIKCFSVIITGRYTLLFKQNHVPMTFDLSFNQKISGSVILAWSLQSSHCFLATGQETLFHIVSPDPGELMGTSNHNAER